MQLYPTSVITIASAPVTTIDHSFVFFQGRILTFNFGDNLCRVSFPGALKPWTKMPFLPSYKATSRQHTRRTRLNFAKVSSFILKKNSSIKEVKYCQFPARNQTLQSRHVIIIWAKDVHYRNKCSANNKHLQWGVSKQDAGWNIQDQQFKSVKLFQNIPSPTYRWAVRMLVRESEISDFLRGKGIKSNDTIKAKHSFPPSVCRAAEEGARRLPLCSGRHVIVQLPARIFTREISV